MSPPAVPSPPVEAPLVAALAAPLASSVRKIIHCDCDCFYASVEMRDDPSLRGRPLAVGGRPEHRGVVATCNYEARRFGVHSAMSSALALRKCPDLLILPPAMEKYRVASRQIMAIYRDYTPEVEPLSLDEAYLDVTHTDRCKGSATLMAEEIRARVRETVGVTVSAGVAPNKFVAKIASDWNKPDGLYVVRPPEVDAFVAALPVRKIFGVGKVTAAKLEKLGLSTCAQLREWPLVDLHRQFGVFGKRLYELSRGIDERPVHAHLERKSISVETTYVTDLRTLDECSNELRGLAEQLDARIARAQAAAAVRKLYVKIRFADFQRTTVECVGTVTHLPTLLALLEKGFARRSKPVRLLGVGVRLEEDTIAKHGQFDLFEHEHAHDDELAADVEHAPADETLEADMHSGSVRLLDDDPPAPAQ
ncbi:DNA polymerase IV [Paraburkholderia solisilvae]|nr:DNA polymerase IV [Paraburkholderia solisilvae]